MPPRRGIIPARAGFTTHHPSRKHTIPDHPRSRGVYESKTIKPRRHAGSSPLARGLPVDDNTLRRAFRIIPARAGFTKDKALRGAQNRDHPRSRGVYMALSLTAAMTVGSSPLARGLLSNSQAQSQAHRIIPARAGFTRSVIYLMKQKSDHPRSRGVYRRLVHRRHGPRRIIPARAGFTGYAMNTWVRISDHPRSRGVYTCGSLESQR